MLGEAPLALLREDELPVGEHVELALRALDDLRVVVRPSLDLGRETRGPAVVAASDGAVVDLDAHGGSVPRAIGHPVGVARPRTHAERVASRDGWFPPESVIRRVGNSPLTPLLGGGPAVLLQVAHPLVAAGVVEHSDYRRDLWKRLLHTLRALYLVAYGTKAEGEAAGAAVRAVHARVRGRTTTALGPFPAGTPYSAEDPELMLWVHATLVDCSLGVYTRFVSRLTDDDEERYYRDMSLVARIFGTPGGVLPPTLADFRAWFAETVADGPIVVTPPARDVAAEILRARLPAPMRLIAPAHRLSTAALLPGRLREEYGLSFNSAHAMALPLAARSLRYAAAPLFLAAERIATPGFRIAA